MSEAKKHILVVDDEPQILRILDFLLSDEGYRVSTADSGEAALESAEQYHFDLVVLDLALPGIDGFTVCRKLHRAGIPVLMLSSHDEEEYVISGLETGALDYVRKPFNHRELILRIANLTRRNEIESESTMLTSSELSVNLDTEEVICRGETIHLTPTEYLLLTVLMRRHGALVSWEEILREVWGSTEWDGAKQMIKVNIQRLRSKIELSAGEPQLIVTQWGRGYRFASAVTVS